MARRRSAIKTEIAPDSIYKSKLIAKFVNKVMREGKKSIARRIVYSALEKLGEKVKKEPVEAFQQALDNATPTLEVKTRRIGGANYQVPVEIPPGRRLSLAMGWIIRFASSKGGRSMEENLSQELIDSFNNQGASVKKKEEVHKMAEANRAFAHYKW